MYDHNDSLSLSGRDNAVWKILTRMIVILNRGAGRHHDETEAQIKKFFQKRGIAARLFVARHDGEIAQFAEEAASSDAEVIVAVGADDTIDGIAMVLADTGKILGVVL